MENVFIFIIVAVFVAARAFLNKARTDTDSAKEKNFGPTLPPFDTLTEADRRYREIQEEIRRRIAQRGPTPPMGMPVSSAPVKDYKAGPYATPPVGSLRPLLQPKKIPVAATPPPVMVATPSEQQIAAPDSVPDEDKAYALPEATDGQSAPAMADDSLRVMLASPNAARQAFLLREILDRPLCLRPVSSGGHEDWN